MIWDKTANEEGIVSLSLGFGKNQVILLSLKFPIMYEMYSSCFSLTVKKIPMLHSPINPNDLIINAINSNLINGIATERRLKVTLYNNLSAGIFITPRKEVPGYRHEISMFSWNGMFLVPILNVGSGGQGGVAGVQAVVVSDGEGNLEQKNGQIIRMYGYPGKDNQAKHKVVKILRNNSAVIQGEIDSTAPMLRLRQADNVSLVMNKAQGIELCKIMNKGDSQHYILDRLNEGQRLELVYELFKALKAQVSDRNMVHHDIKPENIIVDMTVQPFKINKITIIDYGYSGPVSDISTTNVGGTEIYLAPEVLKEHKKNAKIDVYSMAILALEILGDDLSRIDNDDYVDPVHYADMFLNQNTIDVDLSYVLEDALEENPELRSDIDAVISGLESCLAQNTAISAMPL